VRLAHAEPTPVGSGAVPTGILIGIGGEPRRPRRLAVYAILNLGGLTGAYVQEVIVQNLPRQADTAMAKRTPTPTFTTLAATIAVAGSYSSRRSAAVPAAPVVGDE